MTRPKIGGYGREYGRPPYLRCDWAQRAARCGTCGADWVAPFIGGRNADTLAKMAMRLKLEWRCFPLHDLATTREGLKGMAAVLHAAGQFSVASRPMADACISAGVHYCDITGEIGAFEALAARSEKAKAAGVMLLPGAGFDVVPSDCLAAHMARHMPEAARLRISIGWKRALRNV